MCGIAGWINTPIDAKTVLKSLKHRGPDQQVSVTLDENVNFAHTRLSIQDIAHASQPMRYKQFTLIYNGEIYNHLSLREHLQEFSFTTYSDTETLLYLLIKYQENALNMLDGMFAFALYDAQQKRILFGRDRAGEKPLYYYQKEQQFLFASELNTLKQHHDLTINEEHISEFLRLGFFYRTQTPYEDVHEFPPACYGWLELETSSLEIHRYWSMATHYQPSSADFAHNLDRTEQLLLESVKARLENSELEVGTFLSGGIDSGLVTAMAANQTSSLKTFTVSFKGTYDEAPLARQVAQRYHTDHTELAISFDSLQNDLESILGNYGEPFADSSAIPSYYVAKAAKEHISVILNGDGADELFGGYRRYVPFAKYDFFSTPAPLRALSKLLTKALPLPHNKQSLYNYAYRLLKLASHTSVEQYLSATTDVFEGHIHHFTRPSELYDLQAKLSLLNDQQLDGLQKLMLLDFNTILPGDLLVKMDIATMAHSLEGRSPFLSKALLEFAPTIATSHKVHGKTTKYLLRELSKKYLPESIVSQPKRGFEVPLKRWVNHDLSTIIQDTLKPGCYAAGFLEKQWFEQLLWDKLPVSAEQRAKMIWSLFTLEIWHDKVYKG